MNTFTIRVLTGIFLCLMPVKMWGQIPHFKAHEPFRKKAIPKVQCIGQLASGPIWFGTADGLISYDGNQYKTYHLKDSLPYHSVTAIAVVPGDSVWLGHQNGAISRYIQGRFQRFQPAEGLPAAPVTAILTDAAHIVWIATYGEGIYYYKNQRLYNINAEDGLNDDFVYTLALDAQGRVWAGTDGGVAVISLKGTQKNIEKITTAEKLPDNIVRRIISDGKNSMWIGMQDGGFCRYHLSSKRIELPRSSVPWTFGAVTDLVTYCNGEIWIGTDQKQLIRYTELPDRTAYRIYNAESGLKAEAITTLFKDMEGSIWVGTSRQILQCPAPQLEIMDSRHQLPESGILGLYTDRAGNLWMSSEKGITRLSFLPNGKRETKNFLTANRFSRERIVSMYEDPFGYMWFGTYGSGVCRLNPANGQYRIFNSGADGLAHKDVITITGTGNIIWLGTLGGGASRVMLKPDDRYDVAKVTFTNFTTQNGLGNNFLYDIHIDKHGNTWFATDNGGLSLMYPNGTFKTFSTPETQVVYSIAEDKNGNIWFSTPSSGLYHLNVYTQKIENYNENNGLREQSISAIAADAANNIVIVYQSGLIDVLNVTTRKFSYPGDEAGLGNMEVSLNAVSTAPDQSIWLGTAKGLIRYEPVREASVLYPTARISNVRIFLKDLDNPHKKVFSHDQHHFTFDLSGTWLQAPDKVVYQYKMENFDMDWSVPGHSRTVTYSNLPPGKYTFRVRAANGPDLQQAPEDSYSFEIMTPLWQRPWFYGVLVASIGALVYSMVQFRVKSLQKTKIELEKKVKARTSEIMQQKYEIEAQRDEIEAQRDNIEEKSATLERALKEIERKNQDITSSIFYARRIQRAILPSDDYVQQVLKNVFVLYKPRDIVSGDFYWVSEKNGKIYVAVADCTGHGVPGAFMSMVGTSLLNEIVYDDTTSSPAVILQQLHTAVRRSLRQEDTLSVERSRDGMDIALCAIDTRTREIEFAGAKRPLYIVKNNTELEELKGDKYPIGGIQSMAEVNFTNYKTVIEPGATLYMFTDGYADQFGGPENRKYMVKNFREKLAQICTHDLELQKRSLEQEFSTWRGSKPQTDDILVMGFRL